MKRKIVDYIKLTDEVVRLLVQKFPDGYGDDDIVSFNNAKGEIIHAVEVKTDDTIYLVKISMNLAQKMEDHSDANEINLEEAHPAIDTDSLYNL
ncbi:hypothetical protein [Pseudotenacibaculum haliotis]|uniref:DNA primase n=1 Tax=Pseudotenacibaculum haliotis TaxID=1862138 RepID=A0ABW5LQG5_9FLAO